MIAAHTIAGLKVQTSDWDFDPEFAGAATRQPGVLVALAETQERSDLAAFLTRQGFNVWAASDGVEAITIYLEHNAWVDVLLIDAELPDLPGTAFLRRFKTHFPGVPCVFRAGHSDTVSAQLAAAGALVVARTLTPVAVADRLREEVAFKVWAEG